MGLTAENIQRARLGFESPALVEALALLDALSSRQRMRIRVTPDTPPPELLRRLREGIQFEDRIEIVMANLLVDLNDAISWKNLGYAGGLEEYAESRLGWSATRARDRVTTARFLRSNPRIRRAYESGRFGHEAVLWIRRAVGRDVLDDTTQQAWVEHASITTIKRLRDEARCARGKVALPRGAGGRIAPRRPMSDGEWVTSRIRAPGRTRGTVLATGATLLDLCADGMGASKPPVQGMQPLWLRLTAARATDFLVALRDVTRILENTPAPSAGEEARLGAAARIARTCSKPGRHAPLWVGLLALLENYAETWDNPEHMPRRAADAVYIRDGWRCNAPGCTSRRNLESHHVEYRSHGGSDALENLVCVCRFHHQCGEHGGLARVRGVAPLGLTWRLGRAAWGMWFQREKCLESAEQDAGVNVRVS